MELLTVLGDSPWALFVSALISSTLLPGGSEALLIWQLEQALYPAWLLLMAATSGNVLGSMLTFVMGRWLALRYPLPLSAAAPESDSNVLQLNSATQQPDKAMQRSDGAARQRAQRWLERFGPLALLMAWLPIVGDPLCLMAGWLRLNWVSSLVMITAGKTVRYLVVAGVAGVAL
ncbi:MAG: DedA family protein [Marinobacterium sp.]|nr:DedA family protein [Marinobacterium sp.]